MDYILKGFFSFKGRFARLPYFGFSAVEFTAVMLFALYWSDNVSQGLGLLFDTALVFFVCIFATWANLAITTKRLHDLGLSAVNLIWVFAPSVVPFFFADGWTTLLCMVLSLVITAWLLFTPSKQAQIEPLPA